MARSLIYVLTLHCALAVATIAQVDKTAANEMPPVCSGGLTTVGQCLQEQHIPLTKNGLLTALHSGNTTISNLAAAQLALQGVKEAIPDLVELLEAKSEPGERTSLADALAQLGDDRGVQTLRHYCDDPTVPMRNRLYAAERLTRYQPKSCPETLIEGLQDDTFRVQALGMIPDFRALTPNESAQVRALLLSSLHDREFIVRLQAAQTMEALDDVSLIPPLQIAMAKESNPSVREAMRYAIESIQKKNQSGASQATK